MSNRHVIMKKVISSSESLLYQKGFASPIDVLLKICFLESSKLDDWRKGKTPSLESEMHVNLSKISYAMKSFRQWGASKGLKPSTTAYMRKTRDGKIDLQFSKSGNPTIERAYRTHYVHPRLSKARQEKK